MSIHVGILLIYASVLAWSKIMYTNSNVDKILKTFKYHFDCLKWNSINLAPVPI